MKPSNLNSKGTEVADPLRPLKEWDLVFILPTGKEHSPRRRLGSTIQLVSCDRVIDDDDDELEFNDASTLLGH